MAQPNRPEAARLLQTAPCPVQIALDRTTLDLSPQHTATRFQAIAACTLVALMVLVGAIRATTTPALAPLADIVGSATILGALLLLGHAQDKIVDRWRETLTLDSRGIARTHGGRVTRWSWAEVLSYAPGCGLLCSDGAVVPVGHGRDPQTQRWLRALIVAAKRRHGQGSPRSVPAALGQLRGQAAARTDLSHR